MFLKKTLPWQSLNLSSFAKLVPLFCFFKSVQVYCVMLPSYLNNSKLWHNTFMKTVVRCDVIDILQIKECMRKRSKWCSSQSPANESSIGRTCIELIFGLRITTRKSYTKNNTKKITTVKFCISYIVSLYHLFYPLLLFCFYLNARFHFSI